jgi:group I intron endonuclease
VLAAEKQMTQGIYKIEAPSGNFYIGSSVKIERRFTQHRRDLRNKNHVNNLLQRSADKYGIASFKFEIIAVVFNIEDLTDIEQFVMDDLNPKYNISRVASSVVNDPAITEKRIKILSKPVVRMTDGTIFSSGYEAARQHGEKSSDNLSTAIKNGWRFAGHFWKFEGSDLTLEQAQEKWATSDNSRKSNAAKAATQARSKAVRRLSDGKIFSSGVEAARILGSYRTAVNDAIRMNVERIGSKWEYV